MKIVHVSDLHLRHHLPGTAEIAERRSRDMPALFADLVTRVVAEGADLFVLSGDLLDYPFTGFEDPTTQAQGETDLRLIEEILARLTMPMVLVRGNHDHPALVTRVFGRLPTTLDVAGHRVICFNDDEGDDHQPRRLGASLRRFEEALDDADSPPQIHVQHYVVWPERNEEYPHTYRDAASMRDQIIESGHVRLVLSGHYHIGVPLFEIDGVYFSTVRGFCEPPHPYAVYFVEGKQIVGEERVL
ncbi:MAG: metallophosphoesterase [Caldilineaceae bacterium]